MAKRTYEFEILARIEKALDSIEQLQKKSQKDLDGINFNTAVTAMVEGFNLVKEVGTEAFHAIAEVTHEAIKSAEAAEEANLRLVNSLRLMGDLSAADVAKFDRLADSIAGSTKFTENAVKGSVALAKQFQLTNAETEKAVRVATDLAAIQGTTLDEATKKVAQTFNGFVDKDLAKMIPGLKNLGLQSLVTGGALGLIAERVQGTAKALGNTFTGSLFRAKEALDNIFGTLGDFIIKNPAIIAGINVIAAGFRKFNEELKGAAPAVRNIVTDGFLLVIQSAPSFVSAIQRIVNNIGFVKLILQEAGASLAAFAASILHPFSASDIFSQLGDDLDDLQVKFGESLNASDEFFIPLIKNVQALADKTTKAVEATRNIKPAFEAAGKNVGASLSGAAERAKGLADQFKAIIESITKDPINVGFDLFIRKKIDLTKTDAIALGVGLVGQVVKGAEGARKVISDIVGGIADELLPGIGGVVSEIVGVLSQGPEKTKEMVDGFVKAIPTIIHNIAESLPVLIEELVRTLPPALAKAMPEVAIGFTVSLVKHIPDIIKGFVDGLIEGAKAFVDKIIELVTGGLGGGNGIFGGGGGNGGFLSDSGIPIISDIGGFLGLDSGGRIPEDIGADGTPVRLHRKEQVLNGDLTDRLERYLDSNEGGKVIQVQTTLVMGGAEFAKAMYTVRKAGHRV